MLYRPITTINKESLTPLTNNACQFVVFYGIDIKENNKKWYIINDDNDAILEISAGTKTL